MAGNPSIPLSRWNARAASLLGAALLACALAVLFAQPAQATSHHIVIKQYAYSPRSLSVSQGDTVTWTNQDSVEHDVEVTKGPAMFHSPMLKKGQSWSFTFTTAGAFSYVCSVHPDMTASISVAASATPTHTHAAPVAAKPTATTAAPTKSTAHTDSHSGSASAQKQPHPIATTTDQATVTAVPSSDLDPLLLVAGTSIAVVVFCLLLMTSRPVGRHEFVDQG